MKLGKDFGYPLLWDKLRTLRVQRHPRQISTEGLLDLIRKYVQEGCHFIYKGGTLERTLIASIMMSRGPKANDYFHLKSAGDIVGHRALDGAIHYGLEKILPSNVDPTIRNKCALHSGDDNEARCHCPAYETAHFRKVLNGTLYDTPASSPRFINYLKSKQEETTGLTKDLLQALVATYVHRNHAKKRTSWRDGETPTLKPSVGIPAVPTGNGMSPLPPRYPTPHIVIMSIILRHRIRAHSNVRLSKDFQETNCHFEVTPATSRRGASYVISKSPGNSDNFNSSWKDGGFNSNSKKHEGILSSNRTFTSAICGDGFESKDSLMNHRLLFTLLCNLFLGEQTTHAFFPGSIKTGFCSLWVPSDDLKPVLQNKLSFNLVFLGSRKRLKIIDGTSYAQN
ncbi:hypothetical protein GQR58_005785 [Nymphon striatum]|nr:hypothetical protein GQR58_005785 [Nymphon striatum]